MHLWRLWRLWQRLIHLATVAAVWRLLVDVAAWLGFMGEYICVSASTVDVDETFANQSCNVFLAVLASVCEMSWHDVFVSRD